MRITTIICVMLMALTGYAQSTTYGSVTLRMTNFETKQSESIVVQAEDIEGFDIPAFIQRHSDEYRIYAYGTYVINDEQRTVTFSNKIKDGDSGVTTAYCEVTEYGMKPFLGVGIEAIDDLSGVIVRRVVSEGVAEQIGLTEGAMIVEVNNEEVVSECDLKMIISQAGIGAEVPVTYKKGGVEYTKYATIGAQRIQKVTYVPCEKDAEIMSESLTQDTGISHNQSVELTVYPNPTTQSTNIRYTNESDSPVSLYIVAMDGSVIESQTHEVITGNLLINYNFAEALSGTYQMVIEQDGQVHIEDVQVIK